jgi:hypothetical protein
MIRMFLSVSFSVSLLVALSVPWPIAAAQGVYKCSAGGKISYADRPCGEGQSTRLPPPAAGVAPPEAGAVATRDARTLVEFEKLRLAREKEQAREQNREQARAERSRQQRTRAALAHRKTCDKLRLRRKWADEDAARAGGKAYDIARRKARRQAEALAVECPA